MVRILKLKNPKKRTLSSAEWLKRQLSDPYVGKAKEEGYRSRAAYKLLEIQEKFNLFKPDMKVVDLGSAPGGWSGVAANLGSKVIAVDLSDMDDLGGVAFIKGDFTEEETLAKVKALTEGSADIVMSDMAANATGHRTTDHLRIIVLCEAALDFALEVLRPGGSFVAKIFQGGASDSILTLTKKNFSTVKHFKPRSSRKESSEYYLVAIGRKPL